MVVRSIKNNRIGYIGYITGSRRMCILHYIKNDCNSRTNDVVAISELKKANTI
jgi:hypothetical protein